ncbi:hypothetical protein NQ317_009217, partial [Molorchus minor]
MPKRLLTSDSENESLATKKKRLYKDIYTLRKVPKTKDETKTFADLAVVAGLMLMCLCEREVFIDKKILDDEPALKTVQLLSKIAITLGVAKSTIFRTIKEYKSTGM